jgi:hypothetical protein
VIEAMAIPEITSAAAAPDGQVSASPRSSQADDIPKTGTSSENGATTEAS